MCVNPPLELGQPAEIEAVEERSGVQLRRAAEVALQLCRFEVAEVDGNPGGIQREHLPSAPEHIGAERLAESEQRLLQTVPGVGGVAVWPEEGDQLVPTDPLLPGGRGQDQERKGARSPGGALKGSVAESKTDPAKRLQASHFAGSKGRRPTGT